MGGIGGHVERTNPEREADDNDKLLGLAFSVALFSVARGEGLQPAQ